MHTRKGKGSGPTLTEMSERRNHRNIAGIARKGQDLVDLGVASEATITKNQLMGQNSVGSENQIMISKSLKTE